MMKNLGLMVSFASVLVWLGVATASAAPQVKITSWQAIGNFNQLGEVCGVVTGETQSPTFLQVVSDFDTHNPGTYHTFVGSDGNFCQVVRTLEGDVQVSVMNAPAAAQVIARFH